MFKVILLTVMIVGLTQPAFAVSDSPCAIPVNYTFIAPPAVEPGKLVYHTEDITIDRPLAVVLAAENRTAIEQTLRATSSLPGVAGTQILHGNWPEAGAMRLTCLTDGGSTEEQVLVNTLSEGAHHFRYEVWHYTTPKARPITYAVGDFLETNAGDGHTRIHWTYGFRLRPDRFPGYLGPLGHLLFQMFYLDTRYAKLMRGALAVRKANTESLMQ